MKDHKLFSISLKMAMIILCIAVVMMFIVKPFSAEFYVTIITIILMVVMILIGTIMIRKGK